MQRNNVELVDRLLQVGGNGINDEGVTYSMETVLPELVLLGDLLVDGVRAYVVRKRAVE
jgi:hypothetical protein